MESNQKERMTRIGEVCQYRRLALDAPREVLEAVAEVSGEQVEFAVPGCEPGDRRAASWRVLTLSDGLVGYVEAEIDVSGQLESIAAWTESAHSIQRIDVRTRPSREIGGNGRGWSTSITVHISEHLIQLPFYQTFPDHYQEESIKAMHAAMRDILANR